MNFKLVENGSITSPQGYFAGGISAGIKKKQELDLGILYSEKKCVACGAFTTNQIKSYPVIFSQTNLKNGVAQLIVANAGCANACTGEEGVSNTETMARHTGAKLGVLSGDVVVASTGVIGVQLPIDRIKTGIDNLNISKDGGRDFARSIMTTDTFPKEIAVLVENENYTIAGVAKGAGMIHPDMATMFCFITTDANVEVNFLRKALKNSVDNTFNMITVDGDTSTSDIITVLANGLAGNKKIQEKNGAVFQEALNYVCTFLAKCIARDGEGATKLIEVVVDKVSSERDARIAARTIAGSSLVKSAIHGNDPNWGRIAAAIGRCPVKVEEKKLEIFICDICVFKNGKPETIDENGLSNSISGSKTVNIKVCLNDGKFSATSWGCDLSEEYVTINSAYTT